MAKIVQSGFDNAQLTFARENLALPPVSDRFKSRLRVIEEWCFATRKVNAMLMYFFDGYIKEVLTTKTRDYVAFSHAGHGINSTPSRISSWTARLPYLRRSSGAAPIPTGLRHPAGEPSLRPMCGAHFGDRKGQSGRTYRPSRSAGRHRKRDAE